MEDSNPSLAVRSSFSSAIQAWIVVLSASLFFFYEFFQMHMFNPISGYLMQDLGLGALQLGYLSSTYLIGNVLTLIPAGLILDRFSVRHVILCALSTCLLGTLCFAVAPVTSVAAIGHFLAGVGNAFCFISCLILTARWFAPRQQALVIGIIVTVAMLGGVCAQTPFSLLVEAIGWRQAVLFDVLLGLVIFLIVFFLVRDFPPGCEPTTQNKAPVKLLSSLKIAMQNPQNWLCGVYTSFLSLPVMLLGAVWGDLYLQQVHHFDILSATQVTSMLFFGTIVGSPLMGAWSDRLGLRRLPMLIGGVASLAIAIILITTPNLSTLAAEFGFFFLGFFTAAQVISYPLIAESNSTDNAATAMSVASVVIMGGPALFQPLFGLFMQYQWDHLTVHGIAIYSAQDYFHAMLLFPVAIAIAIAAIFAAKETTHQTTTKETVCHDA